MAKFFRIKMFNPTEDEINFESFVKFPLFCYKLVFFAFDPLSAHPSLLERLVHSARMNYCRICLCAFVIAEISMCMFSFIIAEDFVTASASVPNVVTVLLIFLKVFVSFVRRKDIWNIFEDMRAIFATRVNENGNYKIKEYLDGYHFFIKIYTSTIILVFLPIAMPVLSYAVYGTMKLTVNYWFPFDAFTPQHFPIALTWVNVNAWNCLAFMLAADSLLYSLITVVAMEFDILKFDLMNIKLTPQHQRGEKLKSLVERHNKLMELGDNLQNIYDLTFLVSFVISSLVMCYVAFMLSTAKDLDAYTFYIPYLSMIAGQILLLCVYGQKILDSSSAIADGIFDCDWDEFKDNSFKKQLILMLHRAQKPKKLTAMGFVDVTLASFTSVSSKVQKIVFNCHTNGFASLADFNQNRIIFYIAEKCLFR